MPIDDMTNSLWKVWNIRRYRETPPSKSAPASEMLPPPPPLTWTPSLTHGVLPSPGSEEIHLLHHPAMGPTGPFVVWSSVVTTRRFAPRGVKRFHVCTLSGISLGSGSEGL